MSETTAPMMVILPCPHCGSTCQWDDTRGEIVCMAGIGACGYRYGDGRWFVPVVQKHNALCAKLTSLAALEAENKRLRAEWAAQDYRIGQALGGALDFPWYKDDPENFPDATEKDGVCVGDETPETLAQLAAQLIHVQTVALQALMERLDRLTDLVTDALPGAMHYSCSYADHEDADSTFHCCDWTEWVSLALEVLGKPDPLAVAEGDDAKQEQTT